MKKIILSFFVFLILFLCLLYFILGYYNKKDQIIVNETEIKVDIKGAINNPGVKRLKYGSTVEDLILLSGGLLSNADTSNINLSRKLNDQEVVIVYTKEEVKQSVIKVIEEKCICPVIINDACKNPDFITAIKVDKKVSLNSANKEELMTLSGIGSSKADLIIEYREQHLFNTIEDIMNVKGIGKSLFEKIKDYITI